VAQTSWLAGQGLGSALGVGRVLQPALDAGVDHGQDQALGQRQLTVLKARAVQQQGVTPARQRARKGVHDPDLHASGRALGALTGEGGGDPVQLRRQTGRGRHQERGRTGKTGARRQVRLHLHGLGGAAQLGPQGAEVAPPSSHPALHPPALGATAAEADPAVDGAGQHQSAHVIDVLSNQVQAPGRTPTPGPRRDHAASRPRSRGSHRGCTHPRPARSRPGALSAPGRARRDRARGAGGAGCGRDRAGVGARP